ncbi:ABC-type phosphate transport system substrate-binding protein [Amycolatopsis sulphurea]|uniref:ABC-type phosphate transport system substrate-binding protein n=1 Tax=Amycolatopsis sulphurea TaxID=76022 RepID=A0A2A9F9A2_9PSEU|nr:substrate-binding domain-containing protein [Amycolatopsis sulphurea]PFG47015.1 ABC-type phosphate transport system substrate-binding protein [Amycolatopsis sulphurea]
MTGKRSKVLVAGLVALSAVLAMGGAAQADPSGTPTYRDIAGTGSDTTQGVMNGLADAITVNGTKVLGSYDAVGSTNITTKDPATNPNCTIARPASSGAGVTALVNSQNAGNNCLQYARSSANNSASFPGANLTYVPFAVDAVTYAVRSDSSITKKLTTAQLKSIYNCTAPGVGTTYKPLLPQFGSGTRAFFLQSLGLTNAADYTTTFPCVKDKDVNNNPIEENTGTYLTEPANIAPYSIAQYQSQVYGVVADVHGKAMLATFNGVNPTDLNTASTFKRDVYNVVPNAALTTAPYNTVFSGSGSAICANTGVITKYGFGINPNCGDTSIHTP